MLLAPRPNELKGSEARLFTRLARKVKETLKNFHKDDEGMNTVEAIILLFVAAIVLLVFFTLIWPLIRKAVMDKLNSLFTKDGQTE